MNIKKVSQSNFKKINLPVLFEDSITDRAFGIISDDNANGYKLGWQSADVEPILLSINSNIYSIGIDLVFVVFDLKKREILLRLLLNYFFYDIKLQDNHLFVITELEILKFNIADFKMIKTYYLPDYFESIDLSDYQIRVKCLGNIIVVLE